jgi:hypothetical protein
MSEVIRLHPDDHEALAAFDAAHTGAKTTWFNGDWQAIKKHYSDDGLTIIFDHKGTA